MWKFIGKLAVGCGVITCCVHMAFINVILFQYQTVNLYETNEVINWIELFLFLSIAVAALIWFGYMLVGEMKRLGRGRQVHEKAN